MQGSSSGHKQEQGLFRKRGAPVLLELFRNASVAQPPVHAPTITPGQQGERRTPHAPQPMALLQPTLFTPGVRPSDLKPDAHGPAQPSVSPPTPSAPAPTAQPPAPAAHAVIEPKAATTVPASGAPVRPSPSGFKRDIGSNVPPARKAGFGSWYFGLSQTGRAVLFGLTGLVILAPIVWMVAFNRGQTQAGEQLSAVLPPQAPPVRPAQPEPQAPPPSIADSEPSGSNGAASGNTAARTPDVDAGVVIGELRKGLNYLIAGTFKRQKDADDTAAFLNSQGLVSRVVTAGEMQGGSSKDLMVVVLYGFPRETLSLTEQVRTDLKANVQRLGQQWKSQNRLAPSDLSQPYFLKCAG